MEEFGPAVISPDGSTIAYVVKRPRETGLVQKQDFLQANDRADIWLAPNDGSTKPKNLTQGSTDGSGYWAPLWSPDSKHMALLSTKGGNVRLWVWDRAANRMTQLTERGVNPPGNSNPAFWLSNSSLLCAVLPEGKKPEAMTAEMEAAIIAMREWPKAWKGQETTANVLDSGVPVDVNKRPQSQLMLIDLQKGSRQVLTGLEFRDFRVSGDHRHIAVLQQTGIRLPQANHLLPHGQDAIYSVAIVDASAEGSASSVTEVREVHAGTMRWSPDGTKLGMIGHAADVPDSSEEPFVCSASGSNCQAVRGNNLEAVPAATYNAAPDMIWTGDNQLLVHFSKPPESGSASKARWDWWLTESGHSTRNLTEKMKTAPTKLYLEIGGNSFVGVVDGHLWRVPLSGEPKDLTPDTKEKLGSVVWPTPNERGSSVTAESQPVSQMILSSTKGAVTNLYRVDFSSGAEATVTELKKASPEATLVQFDAPSKRAIFISKDRSGSYLFQSRPAFESFSKFAELNTFLAQVAEAPAESVSYHGLDGSDLRAWYLLPPGYEKGKHYPVVLWVYAGSMGGEEPST